MYRVPVLGMTGEDDGCIKTEIFDVAFGRDALVGGDGKESSSKSSSTLVLHSAHTAFPLGRRLARLSGCGHFLFAEKPKEAAGILANFFDECEGMEDGGSLPPARGRL